LASEPDPSGSRLNDLEHRLSRSAAPCRTRGTVEDQDAAHQLPGFRPCVGPRCPL